MKKIYLHIEHCKNGRVSLEEIVEASMDKNFVYYGKYKIKKVDTEKILMDDPRFKEGLLNRGIKIEDTMKKQDPRFILVQK